ncbi:MAG: LTA synthase family protein [Clostridia bacterium]|nr:LTA synthase family protein [Clostridia bacterium]
MKLFRSSREADASGKNALEERLSNRKKRFEIMRSRSGIVYDQQRMKRHLAYVLVLALIVTVIIELFNRRGLGKFFSFIWNYPLMFLLDYGIVLSTLMVSQLFRRRFAVLALVSVVWITLSVVNYVVICFRTQPFTLADVMLVDDMFSLITVYFNWFQIIGMFLAIIALVALIVLLIWKTPRRERVDFSAALVLLAVVAGLTYGGVAIGRNNGFIAERFTTIKDAYQDYGFAYTFIDTFADMGISRPDEYSDDTVQSTAKKTGIDDGISTTANEVVMPNIIYVQLESFFNMNELANNIIISHNATPNFNRMLRNWPSGKLFVPVVGGGTANTEFEVLTGMNVDHFGVGEYPYYTVMREMPVESVAHVLRNIGYDTTAIHNYMAKFYCRDEVYSNLGFDVFESMEYMDDLYYGDVGWATDDCIVDSTLDALHATAGRDFVFAVTVGTHGKYPADALLKCAGNMDSIRVLESDEYLDITQLTNFLNLARDMDEFIVDFLDKIEDFDEPTVVVMYGDHLPALDWDPACLDTGNMFETQYFIWNNYGAKFKATDIEAYRLSAYLLEQLGVRDGAMFQYHQSYDVDDYGVGYLTELEILEYDLIYGDNYLYDGEYPYEATEMRMGIHDIEINTVNYRYGRLMIKGTGFNEFSKVVIDGEVRPTAYIDTHTLAVVMETFPEEANSIVVAQISNEDIELSRTDEYLIENVIR